MAKKKPEKRVKAPRTETLSPKQVKAIRTKLGLTQAEAAARIGVSRRTLMYYESPTRGQSPSERVVKLIRLLEAGKL